MQTCPKLISMAPTSPTRASSTCCSTERAWSRPGSSTQISSVPISVARCRFGRIWSARLSNCLIYGMSAWDLRLDQAVQRDLDISWTNEPKIVVDNLEVAQFVHLMLTGSKLREVLSTLATKAVLILGRFSPERKPVLDALRNALRVRGYVPILFDWEPPGERDVTETVATLAHLTHLAHLARFIIADLTAPKSVPHELATIVPQLGSVPVQPII